MPRHKKWMLLGKTVAPLSIREVKNLHEVPVDQNLAQYRCHGTPNSCDINFVTIQGRGCGYFKVRSGTGWIYKFHMAEWPVMYEYLEDCPFITTFSTGVRWIVGDKTLKDIEHKYDETELYV